MNIIFLKKMEIDRKLKTPLLITELCNNIGNQVTRSIEIIEQSLNLVEPNSKDEIMLKQTSEKLKYLHQQIYNMMLEDFISNLKLASSSETQLKEINEINNLFQEMMKAISCNVTKIDQVDHKQILQILANLDDEKNLSKLLPTILKQIKL